MQINTKLQGELRFRVFSSEDMNPDGTLKESSVPKLDTGFNSQLLTDAFFDAYCGGVGSGDGLTTFLQCGTGTAAPSPSDVSITALGPRQSLFSRNWSTSSNEMLCTTEYRFAQGAVVGTVAEVGCFQNGSGGSAMMRSLIKDVGGTPTTITLTSIDYLYVTWRVKATISLSDQTGTISIGGVDYNYTLRPCNWNAGATGGFGIFSPLNTRSFSTGSATGLIGLSAFGSQTLAAVTSAPTSGVNLAPANPTLAAYVGGSKERRLTWSIADSQANIVGGIGAVKVDGSSPEPTGGYQISFSAVSGGGKIPKDNTKTFSFSLLFTWSR